METSLCKRQTRDKPVRYISFILTVVVPFVLRGMLFQITQSILLRDVPNEVQERLGLSRWLR